MTKHSGGLVFGMVLLAVGSPLRGQAGEFKFPVGVAYASGAQEVLDGITDRLRAEGYTISDDFVWPVGLVLNPYYELDMGLGFGASVGPSALVAVDRGSDTSIDYVVPVAGFARYTFFADGKLSPYIRGGIAYNFAGGDYLESGDVGGFGAVGVELWRTGPVGLGIEVGYSTSTVKIQAGPVSGENSVDYAEFTVSIMAVF